MTDSEAMAVILDLIGKVAEVESDSNAANDVLAVKKGQATVILQLAEAHAWLKSAGNAHGGTAG